MPKIPFRLAALPLALALVAPAVAQPLCAPLGDAAEALPLIYLDLPDPIASRVTQPLEEDLLSAQIAQEAPAPLQKLYCDIGMFQMQVRFVQPVEDDAIAAILTEAIYDWTADTDPAGWTLSALSRHPVCARGDEPFAEICP